MHDTARVRAIRIGPQERLAAVCRASRHLLLPVLLLIGLSAAPAVAEDLPDTPANRYLAAEAYLKIYPPDAMVDDITDEMLKVILPQYHGLFRETMKQMTKRINLEEITINAIVKHFTVSEINAMAKFHSSPEGRAILKKMPAYAAEIMPVIMNIVPEAVKSVEEKMRG